MGASMNRKSRRAGSVVAIAGLLGLAIGLALPGSERPVAAQDALGGGNALDSNPRVGGGRINSRSATDNYRARNALVTGNVPGGRGFRGSVGYTAPTDFRGVVGSDATYAFRRDSAFSSSSVIALVVRSTGPIPALLLSSTNSMKLGWSKDSPSAAYRKTQS